MSSNGTKSAEFQKFLDGNQYSLNSILRYEKIFGRTYVSTGGQETTTKFCRRLGLCADQRVLDVGCGIGGSAFHMARTFGATVYGGTLDVQRNIIAGLLGL